MTVEHTNNIINSVIKKQFSCYDFIVRKSDRSNSVYIDIFYCGTKHTLRISDHKAKNIIKSTIVKKNTSDELIIRTIVNEIRSLKNNVFNIRMREISKEMK